LELSRYIHVNPWRVRRSMDPIKYPWSSLGSYVGARAAPSWLTVRDVMSQFGSKGRRGYREFVGDGIKEGIRTPWGEVRGQAVMGSEEFIEEVMNRYGGERGKKREVVRRKELVVIKPKAIMAWVGKYYGIKPQEMIGERLAVYGAEVCGELFNEAIRLDGVTGGGAAFQCSRQRQSAGGRQSHSHDGAVGERVGAQVQESRVLTADDPLTLRANCKYEQSSPIPRTPIELHRHHIPTDSNRNHCKLRD
jgi:hypothetical protein